MSLLLVGVYSVSWASGVIDDGVCGSSSGEIGSGICRTASGVNFGLLEAGPGSLDSVFDRSTRVKVP